MGKPALALAAAAALLLTTADLGLGPVGFTQVTPPATNVRVAKGDTLESIAARHGVSLEELRRINKITRPDQLQIGQQLKLPPAKGVVQIAAGDTLETIAGRHGTSVAALQKLNPAVKPNQLKVGTWLRLPPRTSKATKPPVGASAPAKAILPPPAATKVSPPVLKPQGTSTGAPPPPVLPTSTEERDRAELAQRKQAGKARWKFFGDTVVDWSGWKIHPGGIRVTLVQPTQADVGPVRAKATAVAVQCSSLQQTWRVNGAWEPWSVPEGRSVGQQIVLDLCANVADGPGAAIPPPAPPAP
jgi:LysM repeat protein